MEIATSNQIVLENMKAVQEKIIHMLEADGSKCLRVRHWGNAVQITAAGEPEETREQEWETPGALPTAETFDAKRERLKLRLQLAQRL